MKLALTIFLGLLSVLSVFVAYFSLMLLEDGSREVKFMVISIWLAPFCFAAAAFFGYTRDSQWFWLAAVPVLGVLLSIAFIFFSAPR